MSDMNKAAEQQKLYEGKPVSDEELSKIGESLPEGKHLVETNPGEFHALRRLRG